MDVEPKIGDFTPKMDGENNGKPYEQMDDLGIPFFLETPISIVHLNLLLGQIDEKIPLYLFLVMEIPPTKTPKGPGWGVLDK